MHTCKAAHSKRKGSFAELIGRGCRSKETGLLISPSVFCLLENNHSLPSNILTIRQQELPLCHSTQITLSRAPEHEENQRSASTTPTSPHIFSPVQSYVLMETDALQYVTSGKMCRYKVLLFDRYILL